MAIDFNTPAGQVRVLINDIDDNDPVFTDDEIGVYLALEGDNVKRAAAQALDTIADNEALASKVFRSQDVQTDGAKVADSLRKRAAALREQADRDDANGDDGSYVDITPTFGLGCGPELTGIQTTWWS